MDAIAFCPSCVQDEKKKMFGGIESGGVTCFHRDLLALQAVGGERDEGSGGTNADS